MDCRFKESAGLFGSLLALILIGRAAFVFPLSALSNYSTKSAATKINGRQQVLSQSSFYYLSWV